MSVATLAKLAKRGAKSHRKKLITARRETP